MVLPPFYVRLILRMMPLSSMPDLSPQVDEVLGRVYWSDMMSSRIFYQDSTTTHQGVEVLQRNISFPHVWVNPVILHVPSFFKWPRRKFYIAIITYQVVKQCLKNAAFFFYVKFCCKNSKMVKIILSPFICPFVFSKLPNPLLTDFHKFFISILTILYA